MKKNNPPPKNSRATLIWKTILSFNQMVPPFFGRKFVRFRRVCLLWLLSPAFSGLLSDPSQCSPCRLVSDRRVKSGGDVNCWVYVDQKGCRLTTFVSKHLFVMCQFLRFTGQVRQRKNHGEQNLKPASLQWVLGMFSQLFSTKHHTIRETPAIFIDIAFQQKSLGKCIPKNSKFKGYMYIKTEWYTVGSIQIKHYIDDLYIHIVTY